MNSPTPIHSPFTEIEISITKSRLRIAVAQLTGPSQDSIIPILEDNGHVSLHWDARKYPENRMKSAFSLLDYIRRESEPVDIVIFPEYSFPCTQAISRFQDYARDSGIVIIGGADAIRTQGAGYLENRCPLILPNGDVYWIVKQYPSQWEYQYFQSPTSTNRYRFIWQANGRKYWFAIYVCLDFLEVAIKDLHLYDIQGPGIYFVPMSSPVIADFYLTAAVLLRMPGGSASVLCSSVGDKFSGKSAIQCYSPALHDKTTPAMQLPSDIQALGLFDIDMDNLAPPKITPPKAIPPLSNLRTLGIRYEDDSFSVFPIDSAHADHPPRGIINPYLLGLLGKTMRIAFLEVESFGSLNAIASTSTHEILAVLGQCDLVLTHVHHYAADLFYDLKHISIRNGTKLPIQPTNPETSLTYDLIEHPFFEVHEYYKVLGMIITKKHRDIHHIPDRNDLNMIVRLGKNYNDITVPDEVRNIALENEWILDKTDRIPGVIGAIITISLGNRSVDLHRRLSRFNDIVIPRIMTANEVTSLYSGTGHHISVDYMLRVTASVESLFAFIESLHHWAEEAREIIITSTMVVMKRFADISFEEVFKIEDLPPNVKPYADRVFFPCLEEKDRLRANSLPISDKSKLIASFRRIEQAIGRYQRTFGGDVTTSNGNRERLLNALSKGILYFYFGANDDEQRDGFMFLKHFHDELCIGAEEILTDIIKDDISDELYELCKGDVNIQSQRAKSEIGYSDKIRLIIKLVKERKIADIILSDLGKLTETVRVRNIFAHAEKQDDLKSMGLDWFIETIEKYFPFLVNHRHPST